MLRRVIFTMFILIPVLVSAQMIPAGCDSKLFTKYEQLASFKISKEAFEDSMTVYLKANNAFDPSTKFTGQFILTTKSEILDFEGYRGKFPNAQFGKALVRYSKLWVPAKNNGYEVCAIVKCEFEVKDDRLTVTVLDTK